MWAVATARIEGRRAACLVVGERLYPLPVLGRSLPATVIDLFADWPTYATVLPGLAATAPRSAGAAHDVAKTELLAPLLYPGKVLCAGANYYDHMAEMGFPDVKKETQRLFFFFKPPRNAVVGPGATVVMPRDTVKYDWEIELAAVIGKTARWNEPSTTWRATRWRSTSRRATSTRRPTSSTSSTGSRVRRPIPPVRWAPGSCRRAPSLIRRTSR
jgi:hypothetical protein